MTYAPGRITKKDFETEEVSIDGAAIQRNLDLISKEAKSLQNQINARIKVATDTTRRFDLQTRFVHSFLFGGA